MIVQTKD
jgi:hypothetical protein